MRGPDEQAFRRGRWTLALLAIVVLLLPLAWERLGAGSSWGIWEDIRIVMDDGSGF